QTHQGGRERHRAKDLCGGAAFGCGGKRRARADRSAGRGGPRRFAPLLKPGPSIDLYSVCTNREAPPKRGACHEGWVGKNDPMRVLPWCGPEGAWTAAKHRWSFTELHVPAAL